MKAIPVIIGWLPRKWIDFVLEARWRHPWLQPLVTWGAGEFKNQEGRIKKGPAKGLRFNTGLSHASFLLGTSEAGVQSVIESLLAPGKVFYDVGANVGFFSLLAARIVGAATTVVCFEPVTANLELLEHNVQMNGLTNVVIRAEALGAANGEARFLLSNQPTLGKLAGAGKAPFEQTGETKVMVRRLDDLMKEGLPGPPHLIKIDVEGAENDVLVGASETIRSTQPFIILEMHGTNRETALSFERLGYYGRMLGEDASIEAGYWNGAVLAAPKHRSDMVAKVDELSSIPLGLK